MTRRRDLLELVSAGRFIVDVAARYDPRSVAYRIALKRLEAALDAVGDDPVPEPMPGRDYALWILVAVSVVVLALALYGLVRIYGWFGG